MTRSGIEAHIEHRWYDKKVDIWVYSRHHDGSLSIFYFDEEDAFVEVAAGQSLPERPSLCIPNEMLQAIVDAATPQFPPSQTLDRHLQDAIKVRDRLLTLIEKKEVKDA